MVTIKEIAKMAGVSRGTVDRVVNGRPGVNPETEKRIRTLMEDMGFRPNAAGQMLAARKRKLRLAFLIVHGPEHVFFLDILHAARDKAAELRELGVTVDFYLIRRFDRAYLERVLHEVEASEPDGVAALPLRIKPFLEFMERLNARKTPTVFFNIDEDFADHLCYVGCDYVQSGRVAAGLCALCTGEEGEVGVVTCDGPNSPSFTARMGGFTQELHDRHPGVTLADGGIPAVFRGDNYDPQDELLERNPQMTALYIVNLGDFNICRAARKAAEGRDLAIITNDLIPAQREMLRDGIISATVSQQPDVQGALPLQILYDLLVFGTAPQRKRYFTQLDIHIPQNT